MGYTKIVQYGNVIEHYSYEKNLPDYKPRHTSQLTKKRQKQARLLAKSKGTYSRKAKSIRRSQMAFFRMCHHNNCLAKTIHFLTITFSYDITYKEAGRHVARLMEKLKSRIEQVPISYISVPELTKKGRYHFHLLVYDLPTEIAQNERKTRNIQRLFERGYIDISPTTYTSEGLAGYMAKYMGKALGDAKSQAERGFTCSRNIEKITSAGSNSLDQYLDLIIPSDGTVEEKQYEVKFMGKCNYKKIIK